MNITHSACKSLAEYKLRMKEQSFSLSNNHLCTWHNATKTKIVRGWSGHEILVGKKWYKLYVADTNVSESHKEISFTTTFYIQERGNRFVLCERTIVRDTWWIPEKEQYKPVPLATVLLQIQITRRQK